MTLIHRGAWRWARSRCSELKHPTLSCKAQYSSHIIFPSVRRTTSDQIETYCKSRTLEHDMLTLRPKWPPHADAKLHTIYNGALASNDKTLLYFHGGGFTHPISRGHLELCMALSRTLGHHRFHVLEYTLLPKGKYPMQLAQAVEALGAVLERHEPQHVVLAGDSAGGNLALALLAHLNTPHPKIRPLRLASPLAGAICISPRCSNDTTAGSFQSNAGRDILDAQLVRDFVKAWQPELNHVWAAPNNGTEAFWASSFRTICSSVLLMVGSHECYLDDILSFAGKINAKVSTHPSVFELRQCLVIEGAVHAQTVIDYSRGTTTGEMGEAVVQWVMQNPHLTNA